MPVLSFEESKPHLEPIAQIAVQALRDSNELLQQILDNRPELHDILDSSTKASMLSNIFSRTVRPRFAEAGLNWQTIGRMQHGTVNGVINLRFKKLTLDLHSMNVPTETQNQLYHQWNLPGHADLTQVTFGYIPNPITRTIAGIFFVCPSGWRRNHWSWSLMGDTGGDGGLFGVGPEPTDPDVIDPNLDVSISMNQSQEESA